MLGCDRYEGSDGLGVRRKQAAGGGQGLSVGWSRREAGGGGEDEPIAQRLGWAGDAAGVREGWEHKTGACRRCRMSSESKAEMSA